MKRFFPFLLVPALVIGAFTLSSFAQKPPAKPAAGPAAPATPAPAATSAPSGSFKIGYVDLQRTLNETGAGKAARKKLEADKDAKQKELDKKQKELQKLAEDLEKQQAVLKPEVLNKKRQELQEKYVALQQTYLQLQQDLAKNEAKLVREIFNKASPAIQKIAKDEGFSMIVDQSAILWAGQGLDITDKVNKAVK